MTSPLLAFVDTNVFLEFDAIKLEEEHAERAWHALLKADDVRLVVTPTVIDELERMKDGPHGAKQAKRDRASRVLKALEGKLFPPDDSDEPALPEPHEIQPGVVLMFWSELDAEVFETSGLSSELGDHQLLAYVLSARRGGHRVALLTEDAGARMTARSRRVRAVAPHREWRVGSARAAGAAAAPTKQTAAAERRPDLSLSFWDRTGALKVAVPKPRTIDAEEYKQWARTVFPPYDASRRPLAHEMLGRVGRLIEPSADEIAEYNDVALPQFLARLDETIEAYLAWDRSVDLFVQLPLLLVNNGTMTANRVDVHIRGPKDVTFARDTPSAPRFPAAPERPRPKPFTIYGRLPRSTLLERMGILRPRSDGAPSYDDWQVWMNEAQIRVAEAPHQRRDPPSLRELYLVFEEGRVHTCTLEFDIYSPDVAEPVLGKKLSVEVSRSDEPSRQLLLRQAINGLYDEEHKRGTAGDASTPSALEGDSGGGNE